MVKIIDTVSALSDKLGDRDYYSDDGLNFILNMTGDDEEVDPVVINTVFSEYGNYATFSFNDFIRDIGDHNIDFDEFVLDWIDENIDDADACDLSDDEKKSIMESNENDIIEDYMDECAREIDLYRLPNGDVMVMN